MVARVSGVIAIALFVCVGAYYALSSLRGGGGETPQVGEYVSETLGISFLVPESYVLEEHAGSGIGSVVLIQESSLPLPEGGEGPPSITIDAYENARGLFAEVWARSAPESNFKLSQNGKIEASMLGDASAASFTWSGLYEGRSIVVAFGERVYVFSVTRLTPHDEILTDFEGVLGSVRFFN